MNYAYNWGASVVIMGTLFKLTHLPGANFMLFAGMGTEVLIFFLSAFDLSGVKRDGTNAGASVSLGGNIQTGNIVSGDAVADNTEFSGMSSADDVPAGNRIAGGGPSIVVVQGGSAMQPVLRIYLRCLPASRFSQFSLFKLFSLLLLLRRPRLSHRKWRKLPQLIWSS